MSLVPHIPNAEKSDHECPKVDEATVNGMVWKSPSYAIFTCGTGSGKTNALLAAIGAGYKLWPPYDRLRDDINVNAESRYIKGRITQVVLPGVSYLGQQNTKIRVKMDNPRATRNDINTAPRGSPNWLQGLVDQNGWLLGSTGNSQVIAGTVNRRDPNT